MSLVVPYALTHAKRVSGAGTGAQLISVFGVHPPLH